MTTGPLVSVIMPAYNNGPFLREAVDSIAGQTYQDWELLIVDDASTDETPEILASLSDPRIRTFRLEQNVGAAQARNHAIERAQGKYIALCDGDDICMPNRLEKQVAVLETEPEIGVVSGQMLYFWGDAEPRPVILYPESPEAIERRFARGRMGVAHGAAMIRADLFHQHGMYTQECRRAQDLELFLRFHHHCKFKTLPDYLLLYRHQVTNIPLRKWMLSLRYEHYARYIADQRVSGRDASRLTFQQYPGSLVGSLVFYTKALLRYVNYRIRTERASPHRLG